MGSARTRRGRWRNGGRSRREPSHGVVPKPSKHRRSHLAPLLDLGGLPTQVAEVVQLRPADVTTGHDLDLLEDRRVEREGSLDTDAEGDLADGEGTADAGTLD